MAKDKKNSKGASEESASSASGNEVKSSAELKTFLMNIRDKLAEQAAPPIYAVTALNHVMNLPNIYELLDKENKEISRDIWLRLKQAGMQLKNPPLLFSEDEVAA